MGASTFTSFVARHSRQTGYSERLEKGVRHMDPVYADHDASSAFDSARSQAAYEHGHGGYTGTIAEKHEFKKIASVETKAEADMMASTLIDADDPRISDKWGPAGLIEVKGAEGGFLFFGWASC